MNPADQQLTLASQHPAHQIARPAILKFPAPYLPEEITEQLRPEILKEVYAAMHSDQIDNAGTLAVIFMGWAIDMTTKGGGGPAVFAQVCGDDWLIDPKRVE